MPRTTTAMCTLYEKLQLECMIQHRYGFCSTQNQPPNCSRVRPQHVTCDSRTWKKSQWPGSIRSDRAPQLWTTTLEARSSRLCLPFACERMMSRMVAALKDQGGLQVWRSAWPERSLQHANAHAVAARGSSSGRLLDHRYGHTCLALGPLREPRVGWWTARAQTGLCSRRCRVFGKERILRSLYVPVSTPSLSQSPYYLSLFVNSYTVGTTAPVSLPT